MYTKLVNEIALLSFILISAVYAGSPSGDPGADYYEMGKYDKAGEEWIGPANEGDVVALHNMGVLSRYGLGSTELDLNKAAIWFLRSAQQSYVPAMVSLAEVQSELGQETPAQSWLTLAARWGNTEAIEHLENQGLPVPKADLYTQTIGELNLQRMRETGDLMRPPIRHVNANRVADDDR